MSAIGNLSSPSQARILASALPAQAARPQDEAPPPTAPPAASPPPTSGPLSFDTGYAASREAETTTAARAAKPAAAKSSEARDILVLDGSDAAPSRERAETRTEEKAEARRDSVFEQRAAARGVDVYRTSLQPREDSGSELNARF